MQGQGCGVLRFLAAASGGAEGEARAQQARVHIASKGGEERVKVCFPSTDFEPLLRFPYADI